MHTCIVMGFRYSHIEISFTPKRIYRVRGVHGNRQPAATRFDNSGGWMRVPTSLTQPQQVGCWFLISKPVKPDLNQSPFKIQQFFQILAIFSRFRPFFSKFRPFFHLNPLIFGTINTESGQTNDFSLRFARKSCQIQRDLIGSWLDLARSHRVLKHSGHNRVHPKPTTTRQQLEPTNPLLLPVGYGLKNYPPNLVRVGQKPDPPDPWTALYRVIYIGRAPFEI